MGFFTHYSYEKCDFLHIIPMKNVIFKWVNQQKTAIPRDNRFVFKNMYGILFR